MKKAHQHFLMPIDPSCIRTQIPYLVEEWGIGNTNIRPCCWCRPKEASKPRIWSRSFAIRPLLPAPISRISHDRILSQGPGGVSPHKTRRDLAPVL